MKVLLVDPSLFTGPYDAALSEGLIANGVSPRWAVRGPRPGEEMDLPAKIRRAIFYPLADGANRERFGAFKTLKGLEHLLGLVRLVAHVYASDVAVVHFQWAALPAFDRIAVKLLRRRVPVVLTVHDTTPFNGVEVATLQRRGLDGLMRTVDRLVVHTDNAREVLAREGMERARISVIPHGPLPLRATPEPERPTFGRSRIVLFGRIQSYKGIDVLIEALGKLAPERRRQLEVIVAGEALISIDSMTARAKALGIDRETFTIRPKRLSDQEIADLLSSADAFVYPYRAIETSGVFYLTAGLRKWTIASALGSFRELLAGANQAGRLVAPGDIDELAAALDECVGGPPTAAPLRGVPNWNEIGRKTRQLYADLADQKGLSTAPLSLSRSG